MHVERADALRQRAGAGYRVTVQWVWFPNLEPENVVVRDGSDEVIVVRSIFMKRSISR